MTAISATHAQNRPLPFMLMTLTSAGKAVRTSLSLPVQFFGVTMGGAGTSGTAQIAVDGRPIISFDNATTQGDLVQPSTTAAGQVHDIGSASCPTNTALLPIVGMVLSTNAGPGDYPVQWGNFNCTVGSGAPLRVSSKTTNYAVVSIADDGIWFDNSGGSSSVLTQFTLPSAPIVGDNFCFAVVTTGTGGGVEVMANVGQRVTLPGSTGSPGGNLQSVQPGDTVCVYYQSTTAIFVRTYTGSWALN
jgi:hypothetical protein